MAQLGLGGPEAVIARPHMNVLSCFKVVVLSHNRYVKLKHLVVLPHSICFGCFKVVVLRHGGVLGIFAVDVRSRILLPAFNQVLVRAPLLLFSVAEDGLSLCMIEKHSAALV